MLNPTGAPNIILHQPSNSARTANIPANRASLESLPIDGMVVNVPASYPATTPGTTPATTPGTVVTGAELELQPLAQFNDGFEANYVVVFIDDPGDLGDDAV